MNRVLITKSTGKEEYFEVEKLRDSLRRSGASERAIASVADHIQKELVEGMRTDAIYRHAFSMLHKIEKPVAARYSMRKAIAELGPSGFPFEKFIAELFKRKGYAVATDQMVAGKCVEHEVDVIAWNDDKLIMAEAKFHNEIGLRSDLKIALYVKARFEDISGTEVLYEKKRKLDEGWLITNTKFTETAIRYGRCAGLIMVGWNYPEKENLYTMVEESGLHPITSLMSLSGTEKRHLLEQGLVLCRSLPENTATLRSFGVSEKKVAEVLEEARLVCGIS